MKTDTFFGIEVFDTSMIELNENSRTVANSVCGKGDDNVVRRQASLEFASGVVLKRGDKLRSHQKQVKAEYPSGDNNNINNNSNDLEFLDVLLSCFPSTEQSQKVEKMKEKQQQQMEVELHGQEQRLEKFWMATSTCAGALGSKTVESTTTRQHPIMVTSTKNEKTKIGAYTPAERRERIRIYREKRKRRRFNVVRYPAKQQKSVTKLRVNGRFVKKSDYARVALEAAKAKAEAQLKKKNSGGDRSKKRRLSSSNNNDVILTAKDKKSKRGRGGKAAINPFIISSKEILPFVLSDGHAANKQHKNSNFLLVENNTLLTEKSITAILNSNGNGSKIANELYENSPVFSNSHLRACGRRESMNSTSADLSFIDNLIFL